MPAAAWEVAAAEAEGVELNFLVAPVRVIEKDGHLAGLECIKMELGEPDASGRRRPVPSPDRSLSLSWIRSLLRLARRSNRKGWVWRPNAATWSSTARP